MANAIAAARAFGRSVRGRSVLLAVIVVVLTLVLGAFSLLEIFERRLVTNLDNTLEQQVVDRVSLLESGGSKDLLTTVFDAESFVWIGTANGEATATGGTIRPVDSPVPDSIGQTATVDLLVEEIKPGEFETEVQTLRIASASAGTGEVVVAGAELDAVNSAVGDLAGLFAVSIPLVAALVGALVWVTAGRALAPVEAIRRQAREIGGASLGDRVPVPESGDEITELAVTVNDMLARIEHHDAAIRQFSSDASHELKSPIANIAALVETADSADPGWPALKAKLTSEAERLSALVDNLLFLSTHQEGDRLTDTVDVQLDELLFAEAELIGATTPLRVGFGSVEPVTVAGSTADLARLVRNLVDNAARHARRRIELGLVSGPGGIQLTVSDDGPGIDPADRQRVFDRFTRLDQARSRDDGGTGLGLSIVTQIADAHGAAIEVDDSMLGGARFTVSWPGPASGEGTPSSTARPDCG